MIRIYKQDDKKYVTKGAYEMFYKPLGYKIVLEEKPQKIEEPKKENRVQLDEEVRTTKRTRGSSNKKNEEGEPNALSNRE
jgi:hypothetical protein